MLHLLFLVLEVVNGVTFSGKYDCRTVDRELLCVPADLGPSPVPSPSPTHEPSPIPSPSPSPSPSPTPSPEPSPSPTPSPEPSPSPSPNPEVCQWGINVPHATETNFPKCLPPPPPVTCASLPDDPTGLLRDGFGCDSKGGSGTGIIRVSVLGPDGAVGSLRWAYNQIGTLNRRVIFDPLVGDVILDTPLYWNKPYTTLDFSAADITVKARDDDKNGLVFTATHDLIVYSGRGKGHFAGGGPNWVQKNNTGNFTLDGDGSPFKYSWDDKYDNTSPYELRGVRNSIFDRNTLSLCTDDCLASWMGIHDVSFTRNFVYKSFHPTTMGANGMPLQKGRERLRVSYRYNVWLKNGERQVVSRRETYYLVYDNNIVMDWTEYISKVCTKVDPNNNKICLLWEVQSNWPYGFQFSTEAPLGNDFNWVTNNCFIPPPAGSLHQLWGLVVENLGCEDALNCCVNKPGGCNLESGKDIQCCNKPMKNTHWAMWNNTGAAIEGNKNNPPEWKPPALSFPLVAIDRVTILDMVGTVRRNNQENELLQLVRNSLNKCVAP